MKEEEVGTVSYKPCETNLVHEEVTQRFGGGWIGNNFLERQERLAVVRGAAGSLAFRRVLFALKASSIPLNLASNYGGGKSERDQADATF